MADTWEGNGIGFAIREAVAWSHHGIIGFNWIFPVAKS
jgi:hypothetical protein